jgi:hypothetical protein
MEHDLAPVTCPICGIKFGMPEIKLRFLYEYEGDFWCPNGDKLHFASKTKTTQRRQKKYRRAARRFR